MPEAGGPPALRNSEARARQTLLSEWDQQIRARLQSMITLHQFQVSPFCDKIRRILHWKGIDYRIQEVPLARAPAIRRINPIGKLPCLEHDGTFVADSTDIAHYLEEKFPEPPILPRDPAERALCHVLDDWADESRQSEGHACQDITPGIEK